MTPEPRPALELEGLDSPEVAALCDGHLACCLDDVVGELVADGYDPELAELHVLASLARRLEQRLPEAVRRGRQAWLTWDDLALVLDIPAATLRRYHGYADPRNGAPIDP